MSQWLYKHLFLINFPIKHSLWNPLNMFCSAPCLISDIVHLSKQKSTTSFQLIFNIFYRLSRKRGGKGYQVCILTFSLWFHISRQEDLQNDRNMSGSWGYCLLISEETELSGTFEKFSLIFMVFLCSKYYYSSKPY